MSNNQYLTKVTRILRLAKYKKMNLERYFQIAQSITDEFLGNELETIEGIIREYKTKGTVTFVKEELRKTLSIVSAFTYGGAEALPFDQGGPGILTQSKKALSCNFFSFFDFDSAFFDIVVASNQIHVIGVWIWNFNDSMGT